MIPGFEDFTYEITTEEQKAVEFLIPHLKLKKGKAEAVKNGRIGKFLESNGYGNFTGARVRKLINYIRVNKLVENLIANSRGYFVASDISEVFVFLESLKRRENEINKVRSSYNTDITLF